MKDALKWILLAAGGYLAIRATGITLPTFGGAPDTDPNRVRTTAGGKETHGTNSSASKNEPSNSRGSGTVGKSARASTNQTNVNERNDIIRRAAAGSAENIQKAVALGIKFNADQWNWYRQQETGIATTVDLFPGEDRAALMNAAEYIARRQGAGLGWLGRQRF